jgi:hypothetical protein
MRLPLSLAETTLIELTARGEVPLGQLADRIVAFLREHREDPQALITWRERNRHALREFWARAPGDALGVNRSSRRRWRQADDITRPRGTPQNAKPNCATTPKATVTGPRRPPRRPRQRTHGRGHRLCTVLSAWRVHTASVHDAFRCGRAARCNTNAGGVSLAAAPLTQHTLDPWHLVDQAPAREPRCSRTRHLRRYQYRTRRSW